MATSGISSRLLLGFVNFSLQVLGVDALHRTIGNPNDAIIQRVVQQCLASNPSSGFGYGRCPSLLRCTLDNLPSDLTAGMQSGANIASLLPTILALIGASPDELVQLAFISPPRAIATCVFAIGLPSGLFRQLSKNRPYLVTNPNKPEKSEWRIPVPRRTKPVKVPRPIKSLLIDLAILALAAVMLWRNVVIGYQSMVTWRCEYSWLLICWPVACVGWLIIAIGLLHVLATKIDVTYSEDAEGIQRSRLDLLMLPYREPTRRRTDSSEPNTQELKSPTQQTATATTSADAEDVPYMAVTVHMRYKNSWAWFQAFIEALAVGIYLYATFVLTSSLFIDGNAGIVYMTTMVLCLSAVRILEAL